jgi:DNA-binding NarL/FixJ family response regulator
MISWSKEAGSVVGEAAGQTGVQRVLVADDHKVMRQALVAILANQPGIQVVGQAANGREAVELTRALKPDVVLMDVVMPEMDGIAATRQIKLDDPRVRVIGLSMMEGAAVAGQLLKAGAETYLNKGGSAEALIAAIRGGTKPSEP